MNAGQVAPESHARPGGSNSAGTHPSEATVVHTRILRCMLAVEDCQAYWRHVDLSVPTAARAALAFEQRWFGVKSEARLRTIMTDMVERFDAYPEAIQLLHELKSIPAKVRALICHVHTQLADPIYRRFTGELLPERRALGYSGIDRETVARWVDGIEPDRWAPKTCIKFASNLLATALNAGLVGGRRDPRAIALAPVPDVVVGYVLYLLRNVAFAGSLTDNLYLRSLGIVPETFAVSVARVPGVRCSELGGTVELTWAEPGLLAWGRKTLGAEAGA